MQIWQQHTTEPQDIAVLLFPRFSNHCLANAVEPLRAANEMLMQDQYRWRYVTLDGAPVLSSSGLPVLPDCKLRDHPGGAQLWVMASYDCQALATATTARALTAAARRFGIVAGMDTGAWLMAHAGLLDGHTATIHWDEMAGFAETFGMVEAVTDRYVIDGPRVTCGGAMTAFDLVLAQIRAAHGAALALEVAAFFMHHATPTHRSDVYRHPGTAAVEEAIATMSRTVETPLPIAQIARSLDMSQRALTRLFQDELGAPPVTVYKRLRLAAARRYAQQSRYSIAEIALRCGYANAAAMTRAFVQEYGRAPSTFRRGQ